MSNYTVQTNFGAKDDLPSGNAAKVIRGSEFTIEFDNIATAIGTKLDSASGSATNFTNTGTLTNNGSFSNTGSVGVTGTSVFNGNMNVVGVITTDGLTTSQDINLLDDTEINFGASNDLKIYHDSAPFNGFRYNRIQTLNDVTQLLSLQSNVVLLGNHDLSNTYMTANNASVALYSNDNSILQTSSQGATITGASGSPVLAKVRAGDNQEVTLRIENTEGEFDIRCDGGNLGILSEDDARIRFGKHTDSETQVVLQTADGNLGINTDFPTEKLDINSDSIRVRTAKTPASASDTGTQGQIAWDANYMYVCTATNTWKRVALATW
jgi:hypothetical protein